MARPILALDGTEYQRQSGSWINRTTNLRPSTVVQSALDARARANGLWSDVLNLDRLDRPSRAGLRRSPTDLAVSKPRVRPTRLNHEFVSDGRTVRLWGNVADGWQRRGRGVSFNEKIDLHGIYEHPLRIRVKVLRQRGAPVDSPHLSNAVGEMNETSIWECVDLATHEIVPMSEAKIRKEGYQLVESFSDGGQRLKELPAIKFEVVENELTVWVELFDADRCINPGLRLTQRPGRNSFVGAHSFELRAGDLLYALQVHVVAQDPPHVRVPDSYQSLQKGFVAGGRPSSRRGH